MSVTERFHLPLINKTDVVPGPGDRVTVTTGGLLSSMAGASLLIDLCGRENVDVGCSLSPVTFTCPAEDLETIRELLEDVLQIDPPLFDRDASKLVIRSVEAAMAA